MSEAERKPLLSEQDEEKGASAPAAPAANAEAKSEQSDTKVAEAKAPSPSAAPSPSDTKDAGEAKSAAASDSKVELSKHPQQDARPSPSITPEGVIDIQLEALKHNDVPTQDNGIEICFRFASPGNKAFTGPLSRFKRMIRNPLYDHMINFEDATFAPANTSGTTWRISLTKGGSTRVFLWGLSKQQGSGEFANCWMTDSVMLV